MSSPIRRWVLLRGLGRESGHWGSFPERLASQFPGAETHLLDLPGFGRAQSEPTPDRISSVVERVRRKLPSGPPNETAVLGLSLGAMVAMDWVFRHPTDFLAAVWINPSTAWSPWYHRMRPLAGLQLAAAGLLPAKRREKIILALTSNDPGARARATPEWIRLAIRHPLRPQAVVRQLSAAAAFRPPEQSPPIPSLLLTSVRDRLVHPRCSSQLASRWQSLSHQSHPTAGHDLPLDDPEWVARTVANWWRNRTAP